MSAGPPLVTAVLIMSLDLSVDRSTLSGVLVGTRIVAVFTATMATALHALTAVGESAFKCTVSVNVELAVKLALLPSCGPLCVAVLSARSMLKLVDGSS